MLILLHHRATEICKQHKYSIALSRTELWKFVYYR